MQPFRDHADLALGGIRSAPAREQLAGGPVARVPRGTGGDEVAQPRKTRVGARIGAERRAEPRHLGEAARDQGGARVVAESESVRDPRGDPDHVLGSAGELHAADVCRRVERKRVVESARWRAHATSASVLAITLAAGWPAAISRRGSGPRRRNLVASCPSRR
jgi:hypothetical protein